MQTFAVGRRGELYFTSRNVDSDPDSVVWRWDPSTRRVSRFAGREHDLRSDFAPCGREPQQRACELDPHRPATKARFSGIAGLAVDQQGRLLIADASLALRRVELDGTLTTVAGTGRFCLPSSGCPDSGGAVTPAEIAPATVAAGRDDSIWFTSLGDLYRVAPGGGFRRVFTTATTHSMSLAVDQAGNAVLGYWPTGAHARLDRISPSGRRTAILDGGAQPDPLLPRSFGDGALAQSAGVVREIGHVATSENGDIYFTDGSREVRYIPVSGRPPARLALAASAAPLVRRTRALRISFRVDAAAKITLEVVGHGTADIPVGASRTAGTIVWRQRVSGTRLAPGRYYLRVIATDARDRSVTRILPVRIADAEGAAA